MILQYFLIAALIRALIVTENPWLCTATYTIAHFLFGLLLRGDPAFVFLTTAVVFVLAGGYFWLLNRIEVGSIIWWLVALGGIAIGMV